MVKVFIIIIMVLIICCTYGNNCVKTAKDVNGK